MLLRYLLAIPIQLRSWPCERPLATQPRQPERQTRMRFRNTEVSLLLFRSAQRALHKASAYPTQRGEARFLCQLAQKWFYPPSPRAELASRVARASAWISSRPALGGRVQSPPPIIWPLFRFLLRDVLPTTREGAATKYVGSLGTAPSFERKG